MGATPVCQITEAGCIRPDFAACLTYVQALYRSIYGQDVYLGEDCQDGQFMALLANAIHDCNGETLSVYNALSPSTAQGNGLSSVVKINGIRRKSPTYSTADVLVVGQVGAIISGGLIRDADGVLWALPPSVVIPITGQLLVTVTCRTIGAVTAPANTLTQIATPTLGWQSVTNPIAAIPGLPVETDAALRRRQALSTRIPAQTPVESLAGALFAVTGVTRVKVYENDDVIPDANGIPAHSIAAVVEGGDAAVIATLIKAKKTPGVGTYGSILTVLTDAYGIPHNIRHFRPTLVPVAWSVSLRPKAGYTADVADKIKAALAAYTNALGIGQTQELSGAYPAANLTGLPQAATFEVVGLSAARADVTADAYGDIVCPYDGALVCRPDDVTITPVLPS